MSDDFANPTERIARALWDRKPSPVSDEEYEHNLYGNRVGVFGKMLGGLGLDASGERKAQPWGKAIMSTLDAPAGLASSIGQAVTAPARAYRGEIPEGQMIPEGLNFAGSVALGSAAVPRPRGSVGMGSLKEGASHLDMSPEARMARAREMGFNTSDTYYHGTHSDFDQFDTSGIGVLGRGTYFTRNAPGTASVWARGEDGSVIPAYIRGNYPDISEAGALYRYMPGFIQKRMAESRGHDGYTTGGGAIVAVHDPSNIRSVNAAFDPAKSSSANLLAANPETGAAPGLGLMAAAKQEPKGFTAYHGSPHDFDKFDMSKIGTGEGAQAYGHGLYFADSEGVAGQYRNKLANRPDVYIDGEPFLKGGDKFDIFAKNDADRTVASRLSSWAQHQAMNGDAPGDVRSSVAHVREDLRLGMDRAQRSGDFDLWAKLNDQSVALDRFEERGIELKQNGKMYQVRINADPEHFLDWDKPLSQQSEAVRKAYETALTSRGGPTIDKIGSSSFGSSGEAMQNLLSAWSKHDATSVSQSMRDAGIPGIKYLDQGSRSAGEGSRNYVVFDDKLIEILRKYGLLGTLGAGAAVSQSDYADAKGLTAPPN